MTKPLTTKMKMLLKSSENSRLKGKKFRRIVEKKPKKTIVKQHDYSRDITQILKEINNINENIKKLRFEVRNHLVLSQPPTPFPVEEDYGKK